MKRSFLIGLGLVIALAALVLVFVSMSSPTSSPSGANEAPDVSAVPPRSGGAQTARPAMPELPKPDKTSATQPVATREYINSQGQLVRDHRATEGQPEFNPVMTERPGPRKIEPRVVDGVRDTVYDAVRKCSEGLDSSTYGEHPKAQAEVIVSILGGQVTTDQATMKVLDVPDEQASQLRQCVEQKVTQMSLSADGHEEISQYRVTLVFALRR